MGLRVYALMSLIRFHSRAKRVCQASTQPRVHPNVRQLPVDYYMAPSPLQTGSAMLVSEHTSQFSPRPTRPVLLKLEKKASFISTAFRKTTLNQSLTSGKEGPTQDGRALDHAAGQAGG